MRIGLNQNDFAEAGGVKKNSQVSYEKGSTAPTAEYLLAVERKGADIGYILTGRRSDGDHSSEDRWLLDAWHRLSTRERDGIMQLIMTLAGQTTDLPAIARADATSASMHQSMRSFTGEGE